MRLETPWAVSVMQEIVDKEETPSEHSKSTTSDPCMEGYEPAEVSAAPFLLQGA